MIKKSVSFGQPSRAELATAAAHENTITRAMNDLAHGHLGFSPKQALAKLVYDLARAMLDGGQLDAAVLNYEEAIRIYRDVYGEDAQRVEIARAIFGSGLALQMQENWGGSKVCYDEALAMLRAVRGQDTCCRDVLTILNNMAILFEEQGEKVVSKAYYEELDARREAAASRRQRQRQRIRRPGEGEPTIASRLRAAR
mmetsp:Transcript_26849/g.84144  ORF Transcript_26849/g.84144 Transcript_26849/m.84144 type:complete len:198 (-) Transcript_26849:321-914(-)